MALVSFKASLNAAGAAFVDIGGNRVDATDTQVDAVKVLTAALETDTIAVDAAVDTAVATEPDDTDTIAAIGVLQADGASPTEAHVNDLQTAWDALKTDLDAYIAAVNAAKTLSAALETDAIAADAAVDVAVLASAAAQSDNSGKVVISIDAATIDTVSKLRKAFNQAEIAALGSGQLTP